MRLQQVSTTLKDFSIPLFSSMRSGIALHSEELPHRRSPVKLAIYDFDPCRIIFNKSALKFWKFLDNKMICHHADT
jgi:hypothetical protein